MTEFAPLRIALFEPQIPPNTGNIARTSAAFRVPLTLIEPLGFKVDDRSVRRAGLDYWPHVQLSIASNFPAFQAELRREQRLIGCSRRGGSSLSSFTFRRGDVLLFGRQDQRLRYRQYQAGSSTDQMTQQGLQQLPKQAMRA